MMISRLVLNEKKTRSGPSGAIKLEEKEAYSGFDLVIGDARDLSKKIVRTAFFLKKSIRIIISR